MSWKGLREIIFFNMTPAQQWRMTVAAGLLILMTHALWAHGFYVLGPGFVGHEEAKEIARSAAQEAAQSVRGETLNAINSLRSELLEDKIRTLHTSRCRTNQTDLRDEFTAQISRAMSKYRSLNGYYYQLTPCSDL